MTQDLGRPDFSSPGTGGGGQTIAVNQRPDIVDVEIERTDTLDPDESETVEIYAPEGSVYNVLGLFLEAPSVSGSDGTHQIVVNSITGRDMLQGESSSGYAVRWKAGHWHTATEDKQPPDGSSQTQVVGRLRATHKTPVEVQYVNNHDDPQTSPRSYELSVEEVSY